MSLTREFFDRATNITVKVVADSISEEGIRVTTVEVEAPRIILAETNTHNTISKNCSSTRAITLEKAIQQVKSNGFVPLYWGKKQRGMAARSELSNVYAASAEWVWGKTKEHMITAVEALDSLEVHKQIAGRLLEPFQMVKQVLTSTDWDNFFNLRLHPDAQPEIIMLAYKIYRALDESTPQLLRAGEWHLPYVEIHTVLECPEETYYYLFDTDVSGTETDGYKYEQRLTLEAALKYSAARCASISYRTEKMTIEKSKEIFGDLLEADVLHSSPAEHQATPIVGCWDRTGDTFDVFINKEKSHNVPRFRDTWQKGVTHMNRQGQLCSAGFRGWIQHRHTLDNNTCWKFDFKERMKLFK